jgi:hypothetical protein
MPIFKTKTFFKLSYIQNTTIFKTKTFLYVWLNFQSPVLISKAPLELPKLQQMKYLDWEIKGASDCLEINGC